MTTDEIEAFAEAKEEPLKAARQFAHRRRKGIPVDRWYVGKTGAEQVADGIEAQAEMIEMLASAFLTLWNEKQEATRLHSKDSKYRQEAE